MVVPTWATIRPVAAALHRFANPAVVCEGWYAVDERSPETHRGEAERAAGEVAHELAEAGAAYAKVGDADERSHPGGNAGDSEDSGDEAKASAESSEGEGEPEGEKRDEEGGAA